MSDPLTLVFFLWRKEGTSPDDFRSFYNDDHQELVAKTVAPPPLFFERNFVVEEPAIPTPDRSGLLSFDSFTAATFARQADFKAWGTILADPATSRMLEDNEVEFTTFDKRIQLAADVVRNGAIRPVDDRETVCLLRLVTALPDLDSITFRDRYDAAVGGAEPLEGEVRRVRYFPQPTSPLSFARQAWPPSAKHRFQLIEHVTFRDAATARHGYDVLLQEGKRSDVTHSTTIMQVQQTLRPPTAWRDKE